MTDPKSAMFLCDFHIHSQYSDGFLTIPEIVDLFGREGFGAIAITDHICDDKSFLGKSAHFLNKSLHKTNFDYYIQEILYESQRALKEYNMLVIPGVEFTHNSFSHGDSAHIVALGIQNYIDPNLSVDEIIDQVHEQKGIAIAAHPVSTKKVEPQTFHLWHNRDRLSRKIDAWEVASGIHLFEEVHESGLPMVASSDMHKPQQLKSWKTMIDGRRSQKNVLESIIHQDLDFTFFQNTIPLHLALAYALNPVKMGY